MPKSRVTIREVSRLSGVSIATVSRVINRLGNVSPETEARVRQAIESLSYHADPLASGLKSGSSRTIGVVLPRFDNDYFMRALKGIDEVFSQAEYSLMLAATHNIGARERQAIANMLSFKAAGLIVATSLTDAAYFESIDAEQCPIVLIDRVVDSARLDMIAEDHLQPSRAVAQRLVDAGHRRIAIFTGDMNLNIMKDRLNGARQAVIDSGLAMPEDYIVHCRNTLESGQEMAMASLRRWRDANRLPTGIIALNSYITEGIMFAARALALRIPEDISLVGFGQLKSELIVPRITAVAQDGYRIGRLAGERLLERVRAGQASGRDRRRVIVPNNIQDGNSIRELRG